MSPRTGYSQWRRLVDFRQPNTDIVYVSVVYFIDQPGPPTTGFCALYGPIIIDSMVVPPHGKLVRTSDGGRDWATVFDAGEAAEITAITFKDSLNGWLSVSSPLAMASSVYRTRDGGLSWSSTSAVGYPGAFDVEFHAYTGRLFLSIQNEGYPNRYSLDEGLTWTDCPFSNLLGLSFSNSLTGIWTSGYPGTPAMYTIDGGLSWLPSTQQVGGWQPLAIMGTRTFFAVTGPSGSRVFRTDDGGANWNMISSLPYGTVTGTIRGDLSRLVVQGSSIFVGGYSGVLVSRNEGIDWAPICGPASSWHGGFGGTRFYLRDDCIIAPDLLGGIWINSSGNANGPRITLEKDNASRHILAVGREFGVSIYYCAERYPEPIDSLAFILVDDQTAQYLSDSVAVGWQVLRREIADSSIRIVLRRTDATPPSPDSFLIKVSYSGVVSTQRGSTIALDEINFNRDTTFRECMVASLTKNDSLFVDLVDGCGDSLMREFIRTNGLLRIESLRPNPARAEVTLDVSAATEVKAEIEISNALGVVAQRLSREFRGGANTIAVDTKDLASGMYLVRLSAGGTVVSQSFVKE